MYNISANIIIRNEEKRIEPLLQILRPHMDEIIVVDQQSTDSSVDICKKYADKVLIDKCTGYADSSRQLAMDNSKCKWILTIDADEYPTTRFLNQLPEFTEDKLADGYHICVCCLRVTKADELPLSYIMNIGNYIDVPHISLPYSYRLYKKDRVSIYGGLHTGIRPRNNDLVRNWFYNAIVEVKTFEEQEIDDIRYESVKNNTFVI